ncbi:MAG TPA: DinB family protein [Vicinamibacterales bacterium]|nr:DinB family protein [Vicinamibacterales bacterium]
MTIEQLIAQLDAEAPRTRKALEAVPSGRDDWKPHEKSMAFGRLAALVARMPSWISLIVDRDELDLNPPGGGSNVGQEPLPTSDALVRAHDDGVAQARASLQRVTEAHLEKPWRLLVGGRTVSEDTRSNVLRDTFMHLAHHRGQLTVYLRMNGAAVPAIYGPSADDQRFA